MALIPWSVESAIEEALEDAYDDGYAKGQDDAGGPIDPDRLEELIEREHDEFHVFDPTSPLRWPVRLCKEPLCYNWTRITEEMNAR